MTQRVSYPQLVDKMCIKGECSKNISKRKEIENYLKRDNIG
jgi:hypothetical protein